MLFCVPRVSVYVQQIHRNAFGGALEKTKPICGLSLSTYNFKICFWWRIFRFQTESSQNHSKTLFLNLFIQKMQFHIVICTFQINTPTLYKNNQCKTHRIEFRASKRVKQMHFGFLVFYFGYIL